MSSRLAPAARPAALRLVLDPRRGQHHAHGQAHVVEYDMVLAALDFLALIKAPDPVYSMVFTD